MRLSSHGNKILLNGGHSLDVHIVFGDGFRFEIYNYPQKSMQSIHLNKNKCFKVVDKLCVHIFSCIFHFISNADTKIRVLRF